MVANSIEAVLVYGGTLLSIGIMTSFVRNSTNRLQFDPIPSMCGILKLHCACFYWQNLVNISR